MVRECHGDLHARNIVRWRQQWLPFDCLEFDADLRWIDVVSDVAFLFMDLASRGREDLAYEFLSRYLEETGDYAGLRLLPLYGAYRALVRAKVDALGAETAGPDQRKALEKRLAERLAIAVRFIETDTLNVVIMHGVTASGKSWLSERLVCAIHAIRIRSDLERKRLPGETAEAPGTAGVGEGRYSRASIQQTYERLLECSESALEGGCNVIVDATFLQAAHRELFRSMAQRHNARFLIVSCATDPATLEERLAMRARSALDPSEATHAVLHEQLRSQQPLSAGELANAVEVDTRRMTSAEAGIKMVRTRLPLPAIA
jgi:predicted kinase